MAFAVTKHRVSVEWIHKTAVHSSTNSYSRHYAARYWLTFTLRSFYSRFPHQNTVYALLLPHTRYIRTIFSKQYRPLSSSLCSFIHSPLTSSLLGSNILNTLFSDTFSLRSSLNVSDQVSHPYNTTGKIIILYILFFKFLDSKRFCGEW